MRDDMMLPLGGDRPSAQRPHSPGAAVRVAVVCLLHGAVAAPLGAQDSLQVVPDSVACTTCSLDVSAVVELGDIDGPGIVGEQARIVRADDGDYYVSSLAQAGRLLRFSSAGVFQDALGQTGEGPGEYIWPVLMRKSADTLGILDIRGLRLTTIRGNEVATWRLPFIVDSWDILPDGRHVIQRPLLRARTNWSPAPRV